MYSFEFCFQLFQVKHIILKFAESPRPSAWVLERSLDGDNYEAWQYFATSDEECQRRYRLPAHNVSVPLPADTAVVCTTKFSKLHPVQNGDVRNLFK